MGSERKTSDAGSRQRVVDRRIGDFGSKLREARERKGVSLREIANATKISVRALEALERNDISHLPGGIFSRSFVRAYAAETGLDPDTTVDDFVRQFPHDSVIAGHAASVRIDETEDESNRRTARVAVRLIGVTIPVAAVVLYFGMASQRLPLVKSEPLVTTAPADVIADHVGVELTALRECLVTAGVDGQPMVDTRLEAGGRQSFHAQTELTLTVSDPSAIELMINGLRGRTLGTEGVMTTVRLTPDNYKNFVTNP